MFYKQLCRVKPRSLSQETATKVNLLRPYKIRHIIKNLKTEESLIISKPDKGNGCVILNKSDYLYKMHHIISDVTMEM